MKKIMPFPTLTHFKILRNTQSQICRSYIMGISNLTNGNRSCDFKKIHTILLEIKTKLYKVTIQTNFVLM